MSILSSLIGGIGTALGSTNLPFVKEFGTGISSAIGQYSAERAAEKDRQFNAEQAQLNRDFQRQERLETQEYNSPANQVQLLLDAGINPNSMFGNNPFTPTRASTGGVASYSSGLSSSLLTSDAQVANLLAQTRKAQAEADGKEIDNSYAPILNAQMIAKGNEEIGEIASRRGFNEEQTRQLKELFPLLQGKNAAELEKLQKESAEILINIGKTSAEIQRIRKETSNIDTQGEILKLEKELNQFKKDFREKYGVNPDSDKFQSIMQLALSGENGSNTALSMLETVFGFAKGLFKGWLKTIDFVDSNPYSNDD